MTGRSRFDGVPTATVSVEDGRGGTRDVVYRLTRVPLDPQATPPIGWHRVDPGDRLDLIASRHLGDHAAFWRICDANLALDPDALVDDDAESSTLIIPGPGL